MAASTAERELQELRAQLGGEAPQGVHSLPGAALADLAGAVRDARRRQAEALAAAGDRALSHIPRVLRGPIRRITG